MQSKFYSRYPSIESTFKTTEPWGNFENLTQYSAFAIARMYKPILQTICEETNGFMQWPKQTIEKLSRGGSTVGIDLVNAKLEMVSYFFELAYDLCLSPQDNVSQSPGFEKYIGQYGRGREE